MDTHGYILAEVSTSGGGPGRERSDTIGARVHHHTHMADLGGKKRKKPEVSHRESVSEL